MLRLERMYSCLGRNTLNDTQQKAGIAGMRNFYRSAGIFLRYTYRR
jgi:hypothetical protein